MSSASTYSHTNPILQARNVCLAWEDNQIIVDDVSLDLFVGQTVCLVGKSGTGKSTLLHALAGLLAPKQGSVLLEGQDISGIPGAVSYMFQTDVLLPHMRIADNVALPLLLSGTDKTQARQKAEEILRQFSLDTYAKRWPYELSGGMRQRVAFARTCMMGNNVVLLDEPFSALDAITRAELRAWFKEQIRQRGLSVVMVTHDAQEACEMGDTVFVLAGTPAHIVGVVDAQQHNSLEAVLSLLG